MGIIKRFKIFKIKSYGDRDAAIKETSRPASEKSGDSDEKS